MTTPSSIQETTYVLQEIYEKAKAAFHTAKKKREKTKKKLDKAENKDAEHSELHILHLLYIKAKHKHKSLRAAYELAKFRLKLTHKHPEHEASVESDNFNTTTTESKKHLKKHAQKVVESFQTSASEKPKKNKDKAKKKKEKKSEATQQHPDVISEPKIEKEHKKTTVEKNTAVETRRYKIITPQESVSTVSTEQGPMPEKIKIISVQPPFHVPEKIVSSSPAKTIEKIQTKTATPKVVEPAAVIATKGTTHVVDYSTNDLTLIEGIGTKVAKILNDGHIVTFKQLATAELDYLKNLLRKNRLPMINPGTWAEQAQLVVAGKFDALKELQIVLKGGVKK